MQRAKPLIYSLLCLTMLAPFRAAAAPDDLIEDADVSRNSYTIGVEGFQDRYSEDIVQLREHARFVSLLGEYTHSRNGYFSSYELRGSYGKDNYKSVSGVIDGITQYEGEARVRAGFKIPISNFGGVKALVPYVGLGLRYFYDKSKNEFTNKGFVGYDRRIWQLYIPIGMMWQFSKWGFNFRTTGEFDPLLYGHVQSRFKNFDPQAGELENDQKSGYGIRGEFMIGQQYDDFGWEFGPFVRYWDIKDSDTDTIVNGPNAGTYLEPDNQRLQAGAKLRVTF